MPKIEGGIIIKSGEHNKQLEDKLGFKPIPKEQPKKENVGVVTFKKKTSKKKTSKKKVTESE